MIPIINNPEDRSFTKVFQMMKAKRKSMPQDLLAGFRPRRTSDGPIRGLNLPPVTPEPIVKPLSVLTCDAVEDNELEPEESPEELLAVPVAVAAGEESDPPETDESESGDDSIEQDAYQAEE